ncbi:MAG: serine/threonine protein kinase [Candidatus Obscuribacterales bacterium]|nr:serine/threonine protein kinase [Candidatus Obscuribacterales bacterium]
MPDLSSVPKESLPKIENVEILELLGRGGMSLVFKARQTQMDRIVALKVLSGIRDQEGVRRFRKEAKLTSSLEHPNIVKIIQFGVSNDAQPYLLMEYLDGCSLAEELRVNGVLQLQKFKDVFLPVLSALSEAHEKGLIHRDIKPANIMICKNERDSEIVKLVDFGIAKAFAEGTADSQKLTGSEFLLGSPAYMSPEQCLGKTLDGRSDLYSLACVMYECLCGEPPFAGTSALELMQKHSMEPPPTVSELSRRIDIRKELAEVTLWALAKDPAQRPQSASAFAAHLNEVLEGITLERVPKLMSASRTKNNLAAVLTAGALLFFVGSSALIYRSLARPESQTEAFKTPAQKKQVSISNNIQRLKDRLKRDGLDHYLKYKGFRELARWQLSSGKEEDRLEAEETYAKLVTLCDRLKPDNVQSNKAACIALKAKAECTNGKFSESQRDFETALDLLAKHSDLELKRDIMLERSLLQVRLAKYSAALSDLNEGFAEWSPFETTQHLDAGGVNRMKMLDSILLGLAKMKPRSSDEAKQMILLANRLTETLIFCNKKQEAKYALSLSSRWLKEYPVFKELAVLTEKLAFQVEKLPGGGPIVGAFKNQEESGD